MTRAQRENFTPTDPTEFVADTIASGFESATSALSQVPGEAVDFITQIPDFTVDAVTNTIDEMRDVYDASAQTYNLITDIIETPCEDKWNVIIETALPAAGSSLWMLLTPNPGEMLEEYLSPKGARKAGRGGKDTKNKYRQKGKSGKIRRRWPALPHVDSLIADRLPGAQAIQGRDIGFGQRFLFTGIDVADRVLWYFLVMDVAENFFTKWSSGIMESRFCSRPFDYLIAATMQPHEFSAPGNSYNEREFWEYSAAKGITGNIEPVVHFSTPLNGTYNFSGSASFDEPIQFITGEPVVRAQLFREGEFIGNVEFPFDAQEGDIAFSFGGAFDFENIDEISISLGAFAPFPSPTQWTSGDVMAYGTPA